MHRLHGRKSRRQRDDTPCRAALKSGMFGVVKPELGTGHPISSGTSYLGGKKSEQNGCHSHGSKQTTRGVGEENVGFCGEHTAHGNSSAAPRTKNSRHAPVLTTGLGAQRSTTTVVTHPTPDATLLAVAAAAAATSEDVNGTTLKKGQPGTKIWSIIAYRSRWPGNVATLPAPLGR